MPEPSSRKRDNGALEDQSSCLEASATTIRDPKKSRIGSDVDTMLLLNELGIQCHRVGKIHEAKVLFRESLGCANEGDDVRNSVPLEHDKSNTAGIICPKESEYDEGMHAYRTPLPVKDTSCKELVVATLRYNMGLTLIQMKDFEGARWCFLRALELILIVSSNLQSGENEDGIVVDRLKLHHNIGYCYYRIGQHEESMHFYLQALFQVKGNLQGKLDLAVACNCVAMLHLRDKRCVANDCLELLRTSLANFVIAKGHASLEVATALFNIGQTHLYRAEYHQALKSFQEAAKIRKDVLGGENSIDFAICIFGVGQTFHKLGLLDDAMIFFKKFLEIREKHGVLDRHDIITALNSIAILHRDKGELNEAYSVFEKALVVGVDAFGGPHTNMSSTLISFGSLCFQMGKYDTALKLYEECLKVQKESEGDTSTEVINTLLSVAQIHWHVGRYRSAWVTFKDILALQVQTIGSASIQVASTVSSMALIYCQMERYDDALELYQEALRIRRDYFTNQDHPDIVATLNTIGLVLCKLHEFDLAKETFQECLRSRTEALGSDHLDVSMLMHNLAAVHLDLSEEEDAIVLLDRALWIRKKQLGPHHPEVASTLHHLGQAYQIRGSLEEACECFQQGLEIERKTGSNDKVVVRKLLNLIGNIHLMRAQVPEMMECFTEASRIPEEGQPVAVSRTRTTTLLVTGHNFYDLSSLCPPCAPTA